MLRQNLRLAGHKVTSERAVLFYDKTGAFYIVPAGPLRFSEYARLL